MHMTAHNNLIMKRRNNQITQKVLIGRETFRGWGIPFGEHKNIILNMVIVKDLEI